MYGRLERNRESRTLRMTERNPPPVSPLSSLPVGRQNGLCYHIGYGAPAGNRTRYRHYYAWQHGTRLLSSLNSNPGDRRQKETSIVPWVSKGGVRLGPTFPLGPSSTVPESVVDGTRV